MCIYLFVVFSYNVFFIIISVRLIVMLHPVLISEVTGYFTEITLFVGGWIDFLYSSSVFYFMYFLQPLIFFPSVSFRFSLPFFSLISQVWSLGYWFKIFFFLNTDIDSYKISTNDYFGAPSSACCLFVSFIWKYFF